MLRVYATGDDALSKAERRDNGWIVIRGAVIAKAGVLRYTRGDGSEVTELRDPKVIHAPEALASYEGMPVLLGKHPVDPETGQVTLLNASNTDANKPIGSLRNVRADTAIDPETGEEVPVTRADVTLWSKAGVEAALKGVRGFSVGYATHVKPEAGTFGTEAFDARQTLDIGNHLVLTDQPRAGQVTTFRFDTADAIHDARPPQPPGDMSMKKIKIGDVEYELEDEAADAVMGLMAERDALKAELDEKDEPEGDMEDEDEPEGDMEDEPEDEDKPQPKGDSVADLTSMLAKAVSRLPADYDFDGKEPNVIRADTVKAVTGRDVSGRDPAYIRASFDLVVGKRGANSTLADATRADTDTKPTNASKPKGKNAADAWYNGHR